jgi:hypothetical protein
MLDLFTLNYFLQLNMNFTDAIIVPSQLIMNK